MRKRGKVLRDPFAGAGLLMIEGQQYQFCLGSRWKSEIAPIPGLVVDVELDRNLQIVGITAVSESQIVSEEAATATVDGSKGRKFLANFVPNFLRKRRV